MRHCQSKKFKEVWIPQRRSRSRWEPWRLRRRQKPLQPEVASALLVSAHSALRSLPLYIRKGRGAATTVRERLTLFFSASSHRLIFGSCCDRGAVGFCSDFEFQMFHIIVIIHIYLSSVQELSGSFMSIRHIFRNYILLYSSCYQVYKVTSQKDRFFYRVPAMLLSFTEHYLLSEEVPAVTVHANIGVLVCSEYLKYSINENVNKNSTFAIPQRKFRCLLTFSALCPTSVWVFVYWIHFLLSKTIVLPAALCI